MTTPTLSATSWISEPQGPHPRLTHRGRAVAASAVSIAAVLIALMAWYGLSSPIAWSGGGAGAASWTPGQSGADGAVLLAPEDSRVHVVTAGDTLWDLAVGIDPTVDPRATIEAIQRLNGLAGSDLAIGRELLLPAVGGAAHE